MNEGGDFWPDLRPELCRALEIKLSLPRKGVGERKAGL
jgi:hypothetical protein